MSSSQPLLPHAPSACPELPVLSPWKILTTPLALEDLGSIPLGQEDPLEEEMATHSSTLAWKIPWMEEPGGLQSMGLQRVGHD